jgi:hypothetical protein
MSCRAQAEKHMRVWLGKTKDSTEDARLFLHQLLSKWQVGAWGCLLSCGCPLPSDHGEGVC